MLTDEQMTEVVEGVRPFAGQAFSIQTYVGLTECMGIANRIYDALKSGNWKYLGGVVWRPHGPFIDNGLPIQNKFGFGELPPIPITGIWVRVEPKTEEKTKNAAKALVDALSHAKIDAQVSSYFAMESAPSDANGPHFVESPEKATNIIEIHVGTKRD